MKKNLALLAGGYSGEYAISIESSKTISANINPELYQVYIIEVTKEGWFYRSASEGQVFIDKNNFTLPLSTGTIKFDVVFFGIHGTPGEDGKLQGYFDMLGIPYTGCNSITSGLTFNKIYCNRVVATADVTNVAKSLHLFKQRPLSPEAIMQHMKFPFFIKPVEGGSSLATAKVKSFEEIQPALDAAFAVDSQAMAETFIKGREFTIGVYRAKGELHHLPITEVISENEFFDYQAKYQGASKEVTPAEIPEYLTYKIQDSARRIYDLLNCSGIVRVDFIHQTEEDKLYFLEINTMPGQSAESIVPQQVRAAGGNLKDFYGLLIEEALSKS